MKEERMTELLPRHW